MKFEMNPQEFESTKTWIHGHRKTCRPNCGAAGGQFTYAFTQLA